jgi:hypothetical protein
MSKAIANLMSANGSVSNLQGGVREYRLPRVNPFPKLNGSGARLASTAMPASRAPGRSPVLLAHGGGALPEMATDVIDQDANYAVQNVKCQRSNDRPWVGVGLGRWVGRLLGGPAAARP